MILEALQLKKDLAGKRIIDVDVLRVQRGEVLVVLGQSGAGKSVLLRLLNLLDAPTAGSIIFEGAEVQGLTGRGRVGVARRMAMIFQEPLLFRGTVERNVEYGLKVRRLAERERARRVAEALKAVNLAGIEGRDARTLSGGEAQRVSLARAIVLEPELLMLDEPFASLDPLNRRALQEDVLSLIREKGMTAVFVTHDLDEAALMGDRIAVLNRGRIDQEGSPTEIFYSPANEFVARFVGVENIFEGEVVESSGGMLEVRLDGQVLEVRGERPAGSRARMGLRPEDITLVPASELDHPASTRNSLRGEVRRIEVRGPTARVYVACPFPLTALITRRSMEDLSIEQGVSLGVRFKATAVMLL